MGKAIILSFDPLEKNKMTFVSQTFNPIPHGAEGGGEVDNLKFCQM